MTTSDARGNLHSSADGKFEQKHNSRPTNTLGRNAHPGRSREEQIAYARACDSDIAVLWEVVGQRNADLAAAKRRLDALRTPEERLDDAERALESAATSRALSQARQELKLATRAAQDARREATLEAERRARYAGDGDQSMLDYLDGKARERAELRQEAAAAYANAGNARHRAIQEARAADSSLYEGWQRFWLVEHIHGNYDCPSLKPTSDRRWLPDVSGLSEAEAVAAHGPRLCTRCFPSAPVEWTVGTAAPDPSVCPGSGQAIDRSNPTGRENAHYAPTGRCSSCGEVVSLSSRGSGRARKHPRKA